jgi:hypothetical protein
MNTAFRFRLSLLVVSLAALTACELDFTSDDDDEQNNWHSLGEVPAPASTELNHTPMLVVDDTAFVGTGDGIWQREISRSDDWEQVDDLDGVEILALRQHPTNPDILFAAGLPIDDPGSAPFYRSEDGGVTWEPSTEWPRSTLEPSLERFFDFVIAPDDPDRLYANLSGASIAISTDGGLTWTLANGEPEVFFGDPCVLHILPAQPDTLYQGCEAPLDNAWVATYDIDPEDPLNLPNFTFVAGGPDFALENRRPNSLTSGPARPDTVYAGLEGMLIALEGTALESVFAVSQNGSDDLPYAYIRAIWLDPDDAEHLIFGGGINGVDTELSLFETDDHGANIEQLTGPDDDLSDPTVEQIVPIEDDELAVLISEDDDPSDTDTERTLRVYVFDPNGDPFN